MLRNRTLHRPLGRLSWLTPNDWVESLLFGAVQVLLFAGPVLLAAQMLAMA
jgi:hypothetical protein